MNGVNIMVNLEENLEKYDEIADYLIDNDVSGLFVTDVTDNVGEIRLDVSRYDTVVERIL